MILHGLTYTRYKVFPFKHAFSLVNAFHKLSEVKNLFDIDGSTMNPTVVCHFDVI
jgi:hypothetical protein